MLYIFDLSQALDNTPYLFINNVVIPPPRWSEVGNVFSKELHQYDYMAPKYLMCKCKMLQFIGFSKISFILRMPFCV